MQTSRNRFRRPAFTLIELIVVVTIIAILVSLSAGAVIRFITAQQISNTRTTINKVYDRLNTSYKAYRGQFLRETIPSTPLVTGTALTYHDWIQQNLNFPADANAEARIRVIWIKMRYKQAFPTNFTEALNPWPLPPNPTYQKYLTNLRVTGSTGAPYESSACLLMALTQAQSGSGVKAEDLAGGQSVANFTLPSGQTIPAFVDAWGNPLTFARWPTGSAILNPSDGKPPYGAKAGFNDPGDPDGHLANDNNLWLTTYGPAYGRLLHQLPPSGYNGYSYYLIPMIVSNGPDKKLGLDPTTLTDDNTHASDDDIYSTGAP